MEFYKKVKLCYTKGSPDDLWFSLWRIEWHINSFCKIKDGYLSFGTQFYSLHLKLSACGCYADVYVEDNYPRSSLSLAYT